MARLTRRARLGTALFWIVGGTLHFVIPRQYEAIVPPPLARWRKEIVVASGVAELAGGLAVLPEGTRRAARWWLLATLAAVYPANVHMAVTRRTSRSLRAGAVGPPAVPV